MGALSVVTAIVIGERCHKVWWMTESGWAIIVGMIVGLAWFVQETASATSLAEEQAAVANLEALEFQPAIFTLMLLPPIIFESGYALNHRTFFSNIGGILLFAFLGTLIAFSVTAPSLYYGLGGANGLLTPMESCAFAALIVAVDPVATLAVFSSTGADPKLNSLIFGESVLNDAVAIVLFKTVVQLGETTPLTQEGSTALGASQILAACGAFCLIFCGSVAIGVIGGMAIALLFKLVDLRTTAPSAAPPAELICLICLSYSTFLIAEYAPPTLPPLVTPRPLPLTSLGVPCGRYARLSGIVASLFAGAVCVVYVRKNLSVEGAQLCKTSISALAKLCETVVFVLMGYGFWLYTIGGTPPDVLRRHGDETNHTWTRSTGEVVPLIEPCIPPDPNERVPMEPSFIALTLAICLISRACSVFPVAMLANLCRSKEKRIKVNEQAVIWFSGLRGAIALALAVEFPTATSVPPDAPPGNFCYQREHVVACTIVVVMATVFILGGLTKPVLNLCGVEMGHGKHEEVLEASSPEASRQITRQSKVWWKRVIVSLDRDVLRPVLVAKPPEAQPLDPQAQQNPGRAYLAPTTPAHAPAREDDAHQGQERL